MRVGEAGLGLERTGEILRSDTLFGAIANALSRLNEDVEEFVSRVRNGELRFSSCFPFKNGTYYLPAPHLPLEKKWRFLPLDDFEKVISGNVSEVGDNDKMDFMKKVEIPKVVLDRTTSNSGIYYLTALKFKENSGLYFLVDGRDGLIEIALKYLQDEGIGGKRTWGLGKFEVGDDEIKIREDGNCYVTLSLTYPRDLESVVYWKPLVRSGWINSRKATLRKPKVIMASEGSVFRRAEEGELVNLSIAYTDLPPLAGHEVWVNGKSFLIRTVVTDEA
ncbi:type III-A CRISPR-associated RAMP protein Csm4 [Geoglobus acetivorans]|uniref:CRISPR system Cms protein Csm4 n=1 Tax=Geoglobus acetivorans TaxID=565033 RepID=A0ABZ3H099_GEOAI|nr:type III-A CRISPR-associated RAMP protein Csm4 [Geoglobus acetivorans]